MPLTTAYYRPVETLSTSVDKNGLVKKISNCLAWSLEIVEPCDVMGFKSFIQILTNSPLYITPQLWDVSIYHFWKLTYHSKREALNNAGTIIFTLNSSWGLQRARCKIHIKLLRSLLLLLFFHRLHNSNSNINLCIRRGARKLKGSDENGSSRC